jgi:hypothetical protein
MSRSYTSSPPNAFMACGGTALAFFMRYRLYTWMEGSRTGHVIKCISLVTRVAGGANVIRMKLRTASIYNDYFKCKA